MTKIAHSKITNQVAFLFICCVLLFFLGDVLRKIAIFNNLSFIRQSSVSKVIGLILIVSFFVKNFKYYIASNKNVKIIYSLLILIFIFFIGQWSLRNEFLQPDNLFKNTEYLVKFLYLPILMIVFGPLKNDSINTQKILRVFEITFLVNLFFLVLGLIFDLEIFRTYIGNRDGYVGVYNRSGQASYFFIIFLLYYYYNRDKKAALIKFIIVAVCSIFIGTKRIYLFLAILFLYHLIREGAYKNLKFYKFLLALSLLSLVFMNAIKSFFSRTVKIFINLYEEKGFFSSLTSYRSDNLLNLYNNYFSEYWNWYNYIIGGARFQGYKFIAGNDIVDLFLFFGGLGIIIYAFYLLTLIDFKNAGKFFNFFVFVILFLSLVSGAFLYDPWVNLLFFIMVCYYAQSESKLKIIEKQ
jgi:hypothetical protein